MQKGHIAATAAQKLCLFRLFPIMFNDLINDIPSFIVYKQLRDMLDLVLSVPFRKEWIPVLRDLCIAFQESIILHFPTKTTPKIHFVCEYDQMTKEKWWLLIDMLQTISYNEELFAWQIQSTDCFSIIDPYELKYHHKGLDVYTVNQLSIVCYNSRLTLYQ
ncbi:unnamed protein product [Rotaria sp. Silwood2]|nr:unnamed protein product [Rotaria sp. Silwood2]